MKRLNSSGLSLDLTALRERLAGKSGKDYWRSLEELADTPAFRAQLESEFAEEIPDSTDPVSRRRWIQLLGASLGLAGLVGCTKQPPETIVPYVRAPEEIIPGQPLCYATAFTVGGIASGVLVESHMGRPTKIEGNELHPASLGATDAFAQASILSLYDPDRSKVVRHNGRISSWVNYLAYVSSERQKQLSQRGAGFRILTGSITSPTLANLMAGLLKELPEAKWSQYEAVARDSAVDGARMAFGEPLNPVYRLERADLILSLDSDFLASGPGNVRYARDFAARRRADGGEGEMNRLYVVEPSPSPTGALADHRLPLSDAEILNFAATLASAAGLPVSGSVSDRHAVWARAVAADLQQHSGRSLVIAGDPQPAEVHAIAHALNYTLGNAGETVVYTDPLETSPAGRPASLAELVEEMRSGVVETLLILGGNPVFDAPVDFEFAELLEKTPIRIHLGPYENETSRLCHWHVPETHYLEAWGDARAFDGTVTILQPLILPLYSSRSPIGVLNAFAGAPSKQDIDTVREYWQQRTGSGEFEDSWRRALHDGVVPGTAFPPKEVSLQPLPGISAAEAGNGLDVSFRPDPTIWDGRYANNGWLQELPKPITKLTWDNAILVSPATAERLGVANNDVVELALEGRSVEGPVWILPGQADNCATVHFGYGHSVGGAVALGSGFNAFEIRSSNAPWAARGAEVRPTGRSYSLSCTQHQHSVVGRNLVRTATIEEFREDPHFVHHGVHEPSDELTLYPAHEYKGYSWGMAIDLNVCTGCSACVVACQAENNIPVVGKEEVARGRDMHWLRIDRYFEGELEQPDIHHQPLACVHCENAPCELVCPTAATVHSEEGLNQMVYNRCVGTRYCSNNCPYKVRRFNFRLNSDWESDSLKLMRNPDVTVRSRGVMEKCTYCVQRINVARIEAKKADRSIRDGEVVTACQGACPAQAIVFGDLNDPNSRVAKLKKNERNYGILTELNTRPRTTYLARLRNPNPALEGM